MNTIATSCHQRQLSSSEASSLFSLDTYPSSSARTEKRSSPQVYTVTVLYPKMSLLKKGIEQQSGFSWTSLAEFGEIKDLPAYTLSTAPSFFRINACGSG